jgi:hypothetical protein
MVEEHKGQSGEVYSNRKKTDNTVPLFLNDGAKLEVEEESCCSAHSTLVSDQNTKFTSLKLHGNVMTLKGAKLTSWPVSTEVACWYDTFPFTTTPIPLPHHYDQNNRAFVIYGNVCSVQCGLAYMHRENRKHDLWERVVLFEDMMHKVFKTKIAGCQPAPPFLTLTRFGGFYSIEEYRDTFTTLSLSVITPPFLMYPLVIQEKHQRAETNREPGGAVQQDETVLSTGHVLRGLRRPKKLGEDAAPLTVAALSSSSSASSASDAEEEPGDSAAVPPLSGVSSAVQHDKDFFTKLTKNISKGRGRGRGRGQIKAKVPASNTMLTSYLVNK